MRDIKTSIEAANLEIEQAEQSYELSKAAELKYSVLPALLEQLEAAEEAATRREEAGGSTGGEGDEETPLLKTTVGEEEVS